MGLIKFDFLFAECIGETDTLIEYKCTMDQKFNKSSHTFTIQKSVFEDVLMHQNELANYSYILYCIKHGKIRIPNVIITQDTTFNDIGMDRIVAARYIFKSYLTDGQIPKRVGAISPEFEKRLEKIESSMRS